MCTVAFARTYICICIRIHTIHILVSNGNTVVHLTQTLSQMYDLKINSANFMIQILPVDILCSIRIVGGMETTSQNKLCVLHWRLFHTCYFCIYRLHIIPVKLTSTEMKLFRLPWRILFLHCWDEIRSV